MPALAETNLAVQDQAHKTGEVRTIERPGHFFFMGTLYQT
jgi:hypothetical protein